jgi:hypothetical protein
MVCIHCAVATIFADDLTLRVLSADELKALDVVDPGAMRDVRRSQAIIRRLPRGDSHDIKTRH